MRRSSAIEAGTRYPLLAWLTPGSVAASRLNAPQWFPRAVELLAAFLSCWF